MMMFRSFLFTLVQWTTIVLYSPIALAAYPLPPLPRSRMISAWARFTIWWLKTTCGLSYRVHGHEHLPDGPAVILSKHQSAWETIAFQVIFPPQVWVLKRELLWIPFFGWGLAASHPIAIDRSKGIQALDTVVKQGKLRLQNGLWVIVFPEGTRMAPGERGRYNPGGALLASQANVPVVPVAHNAGVYWPRRGFIKHPGEIQVHIGPVIQTAGKNAKTINREARNWIEETLSRL